MPPRDSCTSPPMPRRQLSVEIPDVDFLDVAVEPLAAEPRGLLGGAEAATAASDDDDDDDEMWDIDIRRRSMSQPRRDQRCAAVSTDALTPTYLRPDSDLLLLGLYHLPTPLAAGPAARPSRDATHVSLSSRDADVATTSEASAQLKLLEVRLEVLEAQHRLAALRCERELIGGGKIAESSSSTTATGSTSPTPAASRSSSASRSDSPLRSASRRRISSARSLSAFSGGSTVSQVGRSGASSALSGSSPESSAQPTCASGRFGGSGYEDDIGGDEESPPPMARCVSAGSVGRRRQGGSHEERAAGKSCVSSTREGDEGEEDFPPAMAEETPRLTCVARSPRLVSCMSFRPACIAPRTTSPVRCKAPAIAHSHNGGVNRLISALLSHRK
ncbi:hypothetical protein CLOM_g17575 [Closterium sp. NIES-68]|nr:hypothetical protein CLOM_g17575 [Closterium sp. NIES-68]GJP86661.1 hypothetical protein CLOP_g16657 [Closterium sp. NIES-67]